MIKEQKICVKKVLGEIAKILCVFLVIVGCWIGVVFGFFDSQINDCLDRGTSLEVCQEIIDLQ